MTPIDLIAWRERHRIRSQAEAARWLGCARNTYMSWEAGRTPIPHYIALACAALSQGVPPVGETR